ncbi:quinone-dependent dihydroorotate dehydrogenase [Bdellovibrio sp. HCB337]|uniref:quinone-dependent dihydroorotate dehydrogenase n=1 Tax=Bdellovibrio sp. HCB337 TaxID=3394358 RepID=UPI0039A667EA
MKPWLLLPPQWAHDLGPFGLKLFSLTQNQPTPAWKSFTWNNLVFKNPLGLAGGVDKNAESLKEWWAFGVGFAEIGTVTPRPQSANPGKIMDRDSHHHALWNKMGFPSFGADEVFYNLRAYDYKQTPVFVNIGKNRDTANEDAVDDYIYLIDRLRSQADAFVVNISSPNTKGLRDLQNKEALARLLEPVVQRSHKGDSKPVLLKLSPDMSDENLEDALEVAVKTGIDGFVLTNTTLSRPQGIQFPAEGGLSGAPLKDLSRQTLQKSLQILGKNRAGKLIVSAGGVMSPEDVFERLQMGADLVEIYSALIFEGPGFFREVASRYSR